MSKKADRHKVILELVTANVIANQRDLEQALRKTGWDVTQATLSRDLRELGIVRAQSDDGPRYIPGADLSGADRLQLETLLPELFSSLEGVGELLVLKTLPSGAQPISEAIDDQGWPEILGTIGGENTILIVCRSAAARDTVAARLRAIADA